MKFLKKNAPKRPPSGGRGFLKLKYMFIQSLKINVTAVFKKCRYALPVALLLVQGCSSKPEADTLVLGKIWTGNEAKPWAEAMAISADTIMGIGTEAEMQAFSGSKTVVLKADTSQLITPGFIDSHTHFVDGGYTLASVKLRDAKTPEEFIKLVGDFAKTIKPGQWIVGGNWDHQNWGGKKLPERSWIDSVTPNNPVWINRLDGHMALANSLALKIAGVTDATKEMPGGSIIRSNGHITGLLKDNAKDLIQDHKPEPSAEEKDKALEASMNYVASNGVTSVVSLTGTSWNNYFEVYKRANDKKKLITRVYAATMLEDWAKLAAMVKKDGRGDDFFTIGALKGFVDGSLGSHTAAFDKPFSDTPTDSGFFLVPKDTLYKRIKAADSAGLNIIVHAIGDKSIHTLLDIFERVEKENGPRDRRFRMEHAQHINPADFLRFAKLNVIPSVQPYHAIDDGRWAEKFIGHERAKSTYAFRSLLDAKARLAFGSDWFVAPASPMQGIYAATTRRTIDDKNPNGWIPEQKITVAEAMKAYTIDGAYAMFQEKKRGSLEPGKLADFVILEKDITKIDPVAIQKVKVLKTYVGGKVVYSLSK